MWSKKNLVTMKDRSGFYDLYTCSDCGFKKKYYTLLRDGKCPECSTTKDDEVWGFWSSKSHNVLKCPWCKSKPVIVPKKGHVNSKFWNLQRTKDEVLFCCPKGCGEKTGKKIQGKIRIIKRRKKR